MPAWSRAASRTWTFSPSSRKSACSTFSWHRRSAGTTHARAERQTPNEASRATALMTVDYARAFKPRWLVLENVIRMRPWSRYDELKRSLQDLGCHLEEHVLVASDFDVPQARRRLFLVGDLKRSPNLRCGNVMPSTAPLGNQTRTSGFNDRPVIPVLDCVTPRQITTPPPPTPMDPRETHETTE